MKIPNATKKTYLAALCILVLSLLSFGANAAIYMYIDGVTGEVTARGYEGWIELQDLSEGLSNPVDITVGGGGSTSKPTLAPTKVTKLLDSTSPVLRLLLAQGKPIREVKIAMVKTGGSAMPVQYFLIDMKNVVLSAISMSGATGDVPYENVSMQPTSITWTYWPISPDGSPGTPIKTGWDFSTNTAI